MRGAQRIPAVVATGLVLPLAAMAVVLITGHARAPQAVRAAVQAPSVAEADEPGPICVDIPTEEQTLLVARSVESPARVGLASFRAVDPTPLDLPFSASFRIKAGKDEGERADNCRSLTAKATVKAFDVGGDTSYRVTVTFPQLVLGTYECGAISVEAYYLGGVQKLGYEAASEGAFYLIFVLSGKEVRDAKDLGVRVDINFRCGKVKK